MNSQVKIYCNTDMLRRPVINTIKKTINNLFNDESKEKIEAAEKALEELQKSGLDIPADKKDDLNENFS